MKNIDTKSDNMCDIMVYLAIFSTKIDKIGPHKMKMSHYLFSLFSNFQQISNPQHSWGVGGDGKMGVWGMGCGGLGVGEGQF